MLATLANNRYSPAKVKYPKGLLPLHRALELKFSSTVILAILATTKEAAKLPSNRGVLPLQQAIESNFSKEVVLGILAANEDTAAAKDSNGTLPIQKAYEFKASAEVMFALLAANTDIAIVKCYDGKILLMGMKDAANTKDENGVLPLHKAIKRKRPKKVKLALLLKEIKMLPRSRIEMGLFRSRWPSNLDSLMTTFWLFLLPILKQPRFKI